MAIITCPAVASEADIANPSLRVRKRPWPKMVVGQPPPGRGHDAAHLTTGFFRGEGAVGLGPPPVRVRANTPPTPPMYQGATGGFVFPPPAGGGISCTQSGTPGNAADTAGLM